jgi:DNA-binding GntR family transcriptional regulator
VHEALRRLSAAGLVHLATSGPARVAEFTRQDIVEIYEMRICLEQAAARQAATRLTDEQLAALREAADELAAGASTEGAGRGWTAKALAFDVVFHDAIAEACGNDRLRREIRKYRHLVRAFCRMSGNSENLRDAYREHLTILAALAARNAETAGRAMREHIEARLAAVLREIPDTTTGE